MRKQSFLRAYWKLLVMFKSAIDTNPFTHDTQVKAYQKMLGLNGNKKAQIKLMKTLRKEIKQSNTERTGTHG